MNIECTPKVQNELLSENATGSKAKVSMYSIECPSSRTKYKELCAVLGHFVERPDKA